jgi:hypothetical protein
MFIEASYGYAGLRKDEAKGKGADFPPVNKR